MPVIMEIACIKGLCSLAASEMPLICAGVLRDMLKPTDAEWLTERFQVAADKRYHQLEKASEEQIPGRRSVAAEAGFRTLHKPMTCAWAGLAMM